MYRSAQGCAFFLQFIILLVLLAALWSWVARRILPRDAGRFVRKIVRSCLMAPFRQSALLSRWFVRALRNSETQYRQHNIYIDDSRVTPLQFLGLLEAALNTRNIIGAETLRVARREWNPFSTRRVYLVLRFRDSVCLFGAALLGNGFLVSWRLADAPARLFLIFFQIPFVGGLAKMLLRPPTFYRDDLHRLFEEVVRSTVHQVTNAVNGPALHPAPITIRPPLNAGFYENH